MSEPTPEKMIEILKNEVWLRDTEIGRLDKEVASLRDEIERLRSIIREIVSQCDQGGESGKVLARDACIRRAREELRETRDG